MKAKSQIDPLMKLIPDCLKRGGWVMIGHDSAIRLDEGRIVHRLGGKSRIHPLSWLIDEMPLLNLALHKQNGVDTLCKSA